MQVETDEVVIGKGQYLIINNGPDTLYVGEHGQDTDDWFPLESGSAITIKGFNNATGVVSDGVSDVGVLAGGTGIFPPAVDLGDVDLSGVQPLDSDLTAIAALTTTSYGRALLTLANAAAADWVTKALYDANTILSADTDNTPSALTVGASRIVGRKATGGIAALTGAEVQALLDLSTYATTAAIAAGYQPLDSDLTSIAALTTTSYGRALLSLANAAAADWVPNSLFDANTTLVAHTDNTPVAVAISANQVVGRGNSGNIKGLKPAETAAIVSTELFTQPQAFNAQTGTSYTLVASDAGKNVTLSNGSAITLTVPQDSDATIAVGTYVDLYQLGAGQVTVVAGTGATLRVSGLTAKARAQYSRLGLQKVSANTWSLFGDLSAT